MFKILVLFSVSSAMKFRFLSQGHIWTPNAGKHCIKKYFTLAASTTNGFLDPI